MSEQIEWIPRGDHAFDAALEGELKAGHVIMSLFRFGPYYEGDTEDWATHGAVENDARTVYAKWGGETGPNLHATREAAERFALEKARLLRSLCNNQGPERIAPLEWTLVDNDADGDAKYVASCGPIQAEVCVDYAGGFSASVWADIGEPETPDYLLFSHANPFGLEIGEENCPTEAAAQRFCQETAAALARWAGGLNVPEYTGRQEALAL